MKRFEIDSRTDLAIFIQKAIDLAVIENRKQYIHKDNDGLYYFTNGRGLYCDLPQVGFVFPGGRKVLTDKYLVGLL